MSEVTTGLLAVPRHELTREDRIAGGTASWEANKRLPGGRRRLPRLSASQETPATTPRGGYPGRRRKEEAPIHSELLIF